MSTHLISIDELRAIGHECALPFDLALSISREDLPPVHCVELVRVIPGRRLVFRAEWQGRNVFAKAFIDAGTAIRDGKHEQHGVELLMRSKVATPELLFAGTLVDYNAFVLIFSHIQPTLTFQQAWRDSTSDVAGQQKLIERMYHVFAALHNAGLMHRDPHQRNFLVTDEVIYTLDYADIEPLGRTPKSNEAFENLATFFAIMHADADDLIGASYIVYTRARDLPFKDVDISILQSFIVRHRRYSRGHYLKKKIFRECSEFICRRQHGQFVVYRRDHDSEELRRLIKSPDSYITTETSKYLKQGRSSTVVVTQFEKKQIVIKRYNIKNFWKAIGRVGRCTRASKSWMNAHRLIINNIKTALPIALIENKKGPFASSVYFISEYVVGPNIADFFRDESVGQERKRSLAQSIKQLFSTMQNLRISHGDMKASNIIIHDDQPYLMDLDSMQQYSSIALFEKGFAKDIKRFMQNWSSMNDVADLFSKELAGITK